MAKQLKYAHEYLDDIEKSEGAEKLAKLLDYGSKVPLNMLLSMNYNSNIKFDLPEGNPPYKRDESKHPDLFPPLASMLRRMQNCFPNALPGMKPGLAKIKKQQIFIEIMESVSPLEADVLLHCKDRALVELYPSITADLVKSVFPDFVA